MERTACCIQIAARFGATWFVVGYCENLWHDGDEMVLEAPFTRVQYHSDLGPVECRGEWPHGLRVPAASFGYFVTTRMPWMDLSFEEIAAVEKTCCRYSRSLPRSGFRRST